MSTRKWAKRETALLSYSDCEAQRSGDRPILLVDYDAHLSAFISDMQGEFELHLLFLKLKNIFTILLTGFGKSQIYAFMRSWNFIWLCTEKYQNKRVVHKRFDYREEAALDFSDK